MKVLPSSQPISKSALSVLFLTVFLDNLGFAIVVPYLYFFVLDLGGSVLLYGVLLASYSLMSFMFTPTVARLSDRYGRRRILLVSLAISSFSYFLFGSAQAIWLLFVGRMLAGTTAATVPVAQAYVADVTTREDRLRYLGLLGASAGLAFILGPAIGGTLSSLFDYAVPSYLASALAFVNLVSAYFRLPEPAGYEARKKTVLSVVSIVKILRQKQIASLLAIYFLFFVAFVFLQTSLSPWLKEVFSYDELQVGVVFFFLGSVSVFTQAVLLPKLSKRSSRLTLTAISIVAFVAGMLALAAVQNLELFFAVTAVIAFGFGALYLTLNTLISINAPAEAQGGTLGVAWAIAGLAQTAAPALAASVFSLGVSVGFEGLVFVVAALIALSVAPLVWSFKTTFKQSEGVNA